MGLRGGQRSGLRLRCAFRRSRRAPARPTVRSGSSAAVPDTFCTTTTSTVSGRPASSGGATWTAVVSGKSTGAPRPRCAWEAGVALCLPRCIAGASKCTGLPSPHSRPRDSRVALPASYLFLCFLSFEKYLKLLY